MLEDENSRKLQEHLAYSIFSTMPASKYLENALKITNSISQKSIDSAPLVSIIIPCYNQAQFLNETVDSVLSQTYKKIEIIIVNDGSPDNVEIEANIIINKNPQKNIKILNKINGGIASARNYGIQHSKGEFILPLDADDKIHPEMIEKCLSLLLENPDISIAYTDYEHFGDVEITVQTSEYNFDVLYSEKCLHTATAVYKKQAWIDAHGYNENMIWGMEDWEFWINCGKNNHKGKRIPEPLFYYRTRLNEETRIKTANSKFEVLFSRIVLNHQELYDLNRILWAKNIWTKNISEMLIAPKNLTTHELNYFTKLKETQITGETRLLKEFGFIEAAIELYKLWLENFKEEQQHEYI